MDYTRSFSISAAGMTLERTRVDVATLNLANAHSVQAGGATAYQPLRVVSLADSGGLPFTKLFAHAEDELDNRLALPTPRIEPSNAGPRIVYEPGHPAADAKGYVAYPGVDTATEMITLMSATRCYEANVAALNAARTMALKTLEIGGA